MKLDRNTLDRLCGLVALHLDSKEKELLKTHLQEVLSHFERIGSVDTKGVEPLLNPLNQIMNLREDEIQEFAGRQDMLDAAPDKKGNLVKVPSTV